MLNSEGTGTDVVAQEHEKKLVVCCTS